MFTQSLKNLCVLVTRPQPQGDLLCKAIQASGGKAVYMPTIDIAPPKDISTRQKQLSKLNEYDWIIFISPQAVYQSVKIMPSLTTNVKIAAIGASTAFALQEAGLHVQAYPQEEWNSEGLLALPEFQTVLHKKIALIQGEGGRKVLLNALLERGAQVVPIFVYQRQLPSIKPDKYLDLLYKNAVDVVICTSIEGMQNVKLLLDKGWSYLQKIPLLVISERMQRQAEALGFVHIITANNPSQDAILEALARGKQYDK